MGSMTADPFDLVRAWYQAFNRADVDALLALYHEECLNEQGGRMSRNREGQRQLFERAFEALVGGFEGGARRTVRTIARVEGGALHAEWRGCERRRDTGEIVTSAGYDEFWIEEGRIRRQRAVPRPFDLSIDDAPAAEAASGRPSRQYPSQPMVGVGAVIVQDGKVVLVRRRFEPLAGQWSLPGGRLELGETLEAGVAREMLEETGFDVEVGPVVDVFDRILLDPERQVRFHYVLIDYLCRPVGGTLAHGSDVDAAVLVDPEDLPRYQLTPKAIAVIERGLAMAKERERASS